MSCYSTRHWFISCDKCGKPIEETYLFSVVLESLRKKGWLVKRKNRDDPTYKIGDNNFYYYCPDCRKK